MKTNTIKTVIVAMTLGCGVLITSRAVAQDPPALRKSDQQHLDSLTREFEKQREQRAIEENESKTLSELKSDSQDTKAKAKEAGRVKDEADDAALQSKDAYRTEAKAQRMRRKADSQAKKAAKARAKADKT